MNRAWVALVAVVVAASAVLAGCGGSSEAVKSTRSTTTTVAAHDLRVQVQAQTVGLGSCVYSPVKKGSTLVAADEGGETVGTATFAKTAGADACDWVAVVHDVPGSVKFLTLTVDGKQLDTISAADAEAKGWALVIPIRPS